LPDVLNAHARSSAFVLASGALHLALSWAPDGSVASPRRTAPRALEVMKFEVLVPPAQREPAAVAAGSRPQPASVSRARSVVAREASRPEPEVVREPAPITPTADFAPDPDLDPTPNLALSSGGPRDLSPLAAARTLVADPGANPSTFTLKVPDEVGADREVDRAAEARLAHAVVGLSRQGEERLPIDQLAFDFTALVSKPWEVILRPLRRPRYNFHGAGFDAIIRADGSVQYRDKAGLHVAFSQSTRDDGRPRSLTYGLGFRFGDGAHTSELRAFLERTRPLRDLLHERYRRVALARADALLKAELTRITISLDSGNDRGAHSRLFTLWDECAEDEVGAVARKRIEAFVREHCSPGSEHTFSTAELTAFNARRVSRQRFDPFVHAEDAAVPSRDTPDAG
jgi:hypothetical protein